jgi:transcriptional regulator with XRE-family HTH domain
VLPGPILTAAKKLLLVSTNCRTTALQKVQQAPALTKVAGRRSADAGMVMAAVSSQILGKRVRSIRRRGGTTLDQLAGATGLNKGYLSRIESGEKSPSIATLLKLAEALHVSTGQLFGEEIAKGDIQIVRARKPEGSRRNKYDIVPLSRGAGISGLSAFLVRPTSGFVADRRAEHAGTEAVYVVEGTIEIQFTKQLVRLSAGDFVQFPGHLTHQIRKTTPEGAALVVVSED